jgi:hypothetical protein
MISSFAKAETDIDAEGSFHVLGEGMFEDSANDSPDDFSGPHVGGEGQRQPARRPHRVQAAHTPVD